MQKMILKKNDEKMIKNDKKKKRLKMIKNDKKW